MQHQNEKISERAKLKQNKWHNRKSDKRKKEGYSEQMQILKGKRGSGVMDKGKKGQGNLGKHKVVDQIQRIKQKREQRRAKNQKIREKKLNKEMQNEAVGKKGDVDFEIMIQKQQYKVHKLKNHTSSSKMKLCVCVRKRPIFKKETILGENDCVSVANPELKIFTPKLKVDGITKYLEENHFKFDNTFNQDQTTEELYQCSVKPILDEIFNMGMITIFAYGQTGSGKTFTMQGIQQYALQDMFQVRNTKYAGYTFDLSFFEIYGGRCYDLLNEKNKVEILEGNNNQVIIQNLVSEKMDSPEEMLEKIKFAFAIRTTHSTVHNDTSSRSHAICHVKVRNLEGKKVGKMIICDLAGSERAQDTQSNKRQRRLEGAEINKSLLALKECIRAMNSGLGHIPFRASKLTLSLRDSFIGKKYKSRVVMIACICPGSSSADHTVNTLRYADRLKSQKINPKNTYQNPEPLKKKREKKREQLPFDGKKRQKSMRKKSVKNFKKITLEEEDKPKNYPMPNKQPPVPIHKDFTKKKNKKLHDDLNFMKQTMQQERESNEGNNEKIPSDDFVNFHEKVSDIIDLHDEMLALHLNTIREDASLLTKESQIITDAQNEEVEYEIDEYVQNVEDIIKKKLFLYKQLSLKIKDFKKALKEEEEMSMKIDTFYY